MYFKYKNEISSKEVDSSREKQLQVFSQLIDSGSSKNKLAVVTIRDMSNWLELEH